MDLLQVNEQNIRAYCDFALVLDLENQKGVGFWSDWKRKKGPIGSVISYEIIKKNYFTNSDIFWHKRTLKIIFAFKTLLNNII